VSWVQNFGKKKSRGTLPTVNVADMNQIFHDFQNQLFIYCHFTAIADFGARGYTRAICMCYVSQTPRKIEKISSQLKECFQLLSSFVKQCAQKVFLNDVRTVIQELRPLQQEQHQQQQPSMKEEKKDNMTCNKDNVKKTLKNEEINTKEELAIEMNKSPKEVKVKEIRVRNGRKVRHHDKEEEYSDLFQVILTPENVQDIIQDMEEILCCFECELQEVRYDNPLQSKYVGDNDITCKMVNRNDLSMNHDDQSTGRMRYRPNRLGHEGYRPFMDIIGGIEKYQDFEQRLKKYVHVLPKMH